MLLRCITDCRGALLFILLIALCLLISDSATPRLVVPQDAQCACVGMELTYTCTAVGRGSTLWTGTAFDCSNNWINLRHSLFNDSNRGATGDCSGGALVGQSIGVTDNCYTSQLHVTVAADMNNETINCDHRPGTEINNIGRSTLVVMTAPLPPPNDVRPILLLGGNLTFQWSSVAPACSSNLEYRINSVNCGNCVLSSNTSATCYGIPQPMATCSFSVQSVVCGNQNGGFSRPLEVMLKVPDVPHITIFPVYSIDGTISAVMVMITNNQTIYPYNGFSVPVSSYTVSFNNSTPGVMLSSIIVSPCVDDVCKYQLAASTYGQTTGSISVAVSAKNELGVGLSSNPMDVECFNDRVNVTYDGESSTITCTFYDPQNITGKSCIIDYRICNSQLMGQSLEASSTPESPNIVTLKLQSIDSNQLYCYNVTASNISYTVIVMGRILGMDGGNSKNVSIIVAVVVILTVVGIAAALIVLFVIIFQQRHKHNIQENCLLEELDSHKKFEQTPVLQSIMGHDRIRIELKLNQVDDRYFELLHVNDDYQLREFVLSEGYEFHAGCAYYEFKNEIEYVSEDKQLVFMKDGKFFLPTVDSELLKKNGFLGEDVECPRTGGYVLFVQSLSGSGIRHLQAGSRLLYRKVSEQTKKARPSLRRLFTDHFKITKVDHDCTLKEFGKEHGIQANKVNVFLELSAAKEGDVVRDVLLTDKNTCEQQSIPKLFTKPSLRLLGVGGLKELQDAEGWRIFVIMKSPFKNDLRLEKDSFVLHECHSILKESFHMLRVGEDNVQMSKFIKNELGLQTFENGRAFYEFNREEDLNYYKEVVKVQKDQMANCSKAHSVHLDLHLDVSAFYSLSNKVPGLCVKPRNLQYYGEFVQSTSYGSRCLKAGEIVLYKMQNELEQSIQS